MKLAISILSSNYDEKETIRRINETDAEYIHVDVMDGHFVANRTKKYEFLSESEKPLDVHLMVSRPFEYILKYSSLPNTEAITIHVELEDRLDELLNYIRERGLKCGLAINPSTSLEELEDYYDLIDEVLVMTVEPGKGGQKMLESVLEKLQQLVDIRNSGNYNFQIIVDGGVNADTIDNVSMADIVVSGSYVCKSDNYQERINQLRLSKKTRI